MDLVSIGFGSVGFGSVAFGWFGFGWVGFGSVAFGFNWNWVPFDLLSIAFCSVGFVLVGFVLIGFRVVTFKKEEKIGMELNYSKHTQWKKKTLSKINLNKLEVWLIISFYFDCFLWRPISQFLSKFTITRII